MLSFLGSEPQYAYKRYAYKKTYIPSGSATAKLFSKLPMNKADEGSLQEINN